MVYDWNEGDELEITLPDGRTIRLRALTFRHGRDKRKARRKLAIEAPKAATIRHVRFDKGKPSG